MLVEYIYGVHIPEGFAVQRCRLDAHISASIVDLADMHVQRGT